MNMKRQRLSFPVRVSLYTFMLLLAAWIIYPRARQNWLSIRQHRLDHTLNVAISDENYPMVLKAITEGARVNHRNELGFIPLQFAANLPNVGMTRLLLQKGADPNFADIDGCTSLMSTSNAKMAELLLQHGANIEAVYKDKLTALIWASRLDRVDVVRVLLEHGGKVGMRDSSGSTALVYAKESLKNDSAAHQIIALLRQHGAK